MPQQVSHVGLPVIARWIALPYASNLIGDVLSPFQSLFCSRGVWILDMTHSVRSLLGELSDFRGSPR